MGWQRRCALGGVRAAKLIWLLILALAAAAALVKLGVGLFIRFQDIIGVALIVIIPLAVSAVYSRRQKAGRRSHCQVGSDFD